MIGATRLRVNLDIARQQRLAADIRRDQAEIATERRIQAPSDDPVGSRQVADIVRAQADNANWKINVDRAADMAAAVDTAFSGTQSLLDAAAAVLLAARSGLQSADVRDIAANQLRGFAAEIAGYALSRDAGGNRLFPDDEALSIPVGQGQKVAPGMAVDQGFAVADRSIVDLLGDAASALQIDDAASRQGATAASLDAINSAIAHIGGARATAGAVAERIERRRDDLAGADVRLIEQRNTLEGADIATVIARLQGRQVSLEAAQAVFARINRQTLFDILG